MTPQRTAILEAFFEEKGHFTAEDLHGKVRAKDVVVGQATIYRTLKLLVQSGVAEAFDTGDGTLIYEQKQQDSHHDHLICERCGVKVEILDLAIEERQKRLAESQGFTLTRHRMLLFGVCPVCRENDDS